MGKKTLISGITGQDGAYLDDGGRVDDVVVTNGGTGYLGTNTPDAEKGYDIWPSGPWAYTFPGQTVSKDIKLGTGKREDDTDDCYYDYDE